MLSLTVPELSRILAELAYSDGGITHRQRSTVRESGRHPALRLCYTRRGELGFTTAALRLSLHNTRILDIDLVCVEGRDIALHDQVASDRQ
eukprot:1626407-Pleurochrysis_carterae.AAC.1